MAVLQHTQLVAVLNVKELSFATASRMMLTLPPLPLLSSARFSSLSFGRGFFRKGTSHALRGAREELPGGTEDGR